MAIIQIWTFIGSRVLDVDSRLSAFGNLRDTFILDSDDWRVTMLEASAHTA